MDALKTIVKSIVISCPDRLTVEQLQYDYKEIEGRALPYRYLGYESPDQMLRVAFKDVVEVYGYGPKALVMAINNAKSEHIMRLVTEQKSSRKRWHTVQSRNNTKYGHFISSERQNQIRNVCLTRAHSKCQYHHNNFKKIPNMNSAKEKESTYSKIPNESKEKVESYTSKWIQSNDFSCKEILKDDKDQESTVPKNAIDSRVLVLDKLRTYQEEVAEQQKEKSNELKSEDVDANELELESYEVEKFEQAFSELNVSAKSDIDITKDDENLVSLDSCSDIFFKPKRNDKNRDFNEAIPDFAFDSRIFVLDFPEFAVKFGTKIKPFEMPQDITMDSIISIYISEIHNPYRFWFHLSTESEELDELMHNIERFYQHMDEPFEYTILPEQIQAGQVCATIYNGLWHRAEILKNYVTDNKVKVFFMDYGTVCDVEISTIKYLRTEFAQLHAFAIRGCLAEITPIGLHWSTDSSLAFLSMSYERLLHAKVCEIDSMNRVYYLTVCDTHEGRIIQLNRELIVLNHALKSFEWSKSKLLGKPRIQHIREGYPKFDMLEEGEYPSLSELLDMKSKNIFYETMTDKLIYHPGILNSEKHTAELLRELEFLLLPNNPFAFDIVEGLTEMASTNKT